MQLTWRKVVLGLVGLGILGFGVLQILPVGMVFSSLERDANPPVVQSIVWLSPEAEEIARRACYDCHSNETKYPWYAHLAPVSWLVTRDVNEGRAGLNFSEYDPAHMVAMMDPDDIADHIWGDMPPRQYLLLHSEAELSEAEKQTLYDAMLATLQGVDSMEGMDH